MDERFILLITGVASMQPVLQSNREPACAGALLDDADLDTTFVNDTLYDIVFATVETKA